MRPAVAALLSAPSVAAGWLSLAIARATRRPRPAPDPHSIDDAAELVDRLADGAHGKIVCRRYLKLFCHLIVRDESQYLYSERDSLIRSMATLAGCDVALLYRDVQKVAAVRDRDERDAEECERLELITGMSGADPFEEDDE